MSTPLSPGLSDSINVCSVERQTLVSWRNTDPETRQRITKTVGLNPDPIVLPGVIKIRRSLPPPPFFVVRSCQVVLYLSNLFYRDN